MIIIRRIVGDSMLPALGPGTLVIGLKSGKPKVGDVVMIIHENKEKIKRIRDIDEYEAFVVGDNPDKSKDSRQFGPINKHAIVARVVWPRVSRSA